MFDTHAIHTRKTSRCGVSLAILFTVFMSRIPQLEAFLSDSPNDPFIHYALALEHIKSGNLQDGLKYFEGLVQQHPDYVGTYYHLAKLYIQLQMPDKAEMTYENGIAVAKKLQDQHALAELQNASLNFKLGISDD